MTNNLDESQYNSHLNISFDRVIKSKDKLLIEIRKEAWNIKYGCEELRNDREIVLEAVKLNGNTLFCASTSLKDDREIVLESVKTCGWALQFASERLRQDKEIGVTAITQNIAAFNFVSERVKDDVMKMYIEKLKRGV